MAEIKPPFSMVESLSYRVLNFEFRIAVLGNTHYQPIFGGPWV